MPLSQKFKTIIQEELAGFVTNYQQHEKELINALTQYHIPTALENSITEHQTKAINKKYLSAIDSVWQSQKESDTRYLKEMSPEVAKKFIPQKIEKLQHQIDESYNRMNALQEQIKSLMNHFKNGAFITAGKNPYEFDVYREQFVADIDGFDSDIRKALYPYLDRAFSYDFYWNDYFIYDYPTFYLLQRKLYWANEIQQFRNRDELTKTQDQITKLTAKKEKYLGILSRINCPEDASPETKVELLNERYANKLGDKKEKIEKSYGPTELSVEDHDQIMAMLANYLIPQIESLPQYQQAIETYQQTAAKISCLQRHQQELLSELDRIIPKVKGHGPAIFSSPKVIRRNLEELRQRMQQVTVTSESDYEVFERELSNWQRDVKMDLNFGWGPVGLLIKLIRFPGFAKSKEIYEDLTNSSAACPAP